MWGQFPQEITLFLPEIVPKPSMLILYKIVSSAKKSLVIDTCSKITTPAKILCSFLYFSPNKCFSKGRREIKTKGEKTNTFFYLPEPF